MLCVHVIVCFDFNNNALLIKIILSSFKFFITVGRAPPKSSKSVITHTTLGDYSFLAEAPNLWNSLPVNICNEQNFETKTLLKTHFLKLAFN